MQISQRFTIAIHILLFIDKFGKDIKITSKILESSTNINAVTIRNILSMLKKSGLVEIKRGSGGAKLLKPLEKELESIKISKLSNDLDNILKN